jgi:hypothetical protein
MRCLRRLRLLIIYIEGVTAVDNIHVVLYSFQKSLTNQEIIAQHIWLRFRKITPIDLNTD